MLQLLGDQEWPLWPLNIQGESVLEQWVQGSRGRYLIDVFKEEQGDYGDGCGQWRTWQMGRSKRLAEKTIHRTCRWGKDYRLPLLR